MSFHVGQKVVCIDASTPSHDDRKLLTHGAIYTIRAINAGFWKTGVELEEVSPEPVTDVFRASRFRPIVEKKTDISIFTAMLTPTPQRRELVSSVNGEGINAR